MKCSAVILFRSDGKVLCTSRRNDPDQWCLPGGKSDIGETGLQTAIRELKEETAVDLLSSVFVDLCEIVDEHGNLTNIFFAQVNGDDIIAEQTELGILVDWKDPNVLIDFKTSPFAKTNRLVFKKLSQYLDSSTI